MLELDYWRSVCLYNQLQPAHYNYYGWIEHLSPWLVWLILLFPLYIEIKIAGEILVTILYLVSGHWNTSWSCPLLASVLNVWMLIKGTLLTLLFRFFFLKFIFKMCRTVSCNEQQAHEHTATHCLLPGYALIERFAWYLLDVTGNCESWDF